MFDDIYNFDQVSKSGKTLKSHKHPHPPGGPRQYKKEGISNLKKNLIGGAIGAALPLVLTGIPAVKALRTLGRSAKRKKFAELSDTLMKFNNKGA